MDRFLIDELGSKLRKVEKNETTFVSNVKIDGAAFSKNDSLHLSQISFENQAPQKGSGGDTSGRGTAIFPSTTG